MPQSQTSPGPSNLTLIGLLFTLVLGVFLRSAQAGVVEFKNGGVVQLPVKIVDEMVELRLLDQTYTFLKEDFLWIEKDGWPAEDWTKLRDEALRSDGLDRFRAAWWALQHGLTDEAVALIQASHQVDPTLQPVARLVEVLDALQEETPTTIAKSPQFLRGDFVITESDHLVLIHQVEANEARQRIEVLEDVLTTFYLVFEAQGIRLKPPSHKLVAVWFAEERGYRDLIAREAGNAFATTRGYYHPSRQIVFYYDGRSVASYQERDATNRSRLEEVSAIENAIESIPPRQRFRLSVRGEQPSRVNRAQAAEILAQLRRDIDRVTLLQERDRIRVDLGTAAHELIHQLAIASGLAPRFDSFPNWLHEGIAMQFEEVRGGHWAGFGRVDHRRLEDWRSTEIHPSLRSILEDQGFGGGFDLERYAAAWAFVLYLRKEEPKRFLALVDHHRAGRPPFSVAADYPLLTTPTPLDLDDLERAWLDYMSRLDSPLSHSDAKSLR